MGYAPAHERPTDTYRLAHALFELRVFLAEYLGSTNGVGAMLDSRTLGFSDGTPSRGACRLLTVAAATRYRKGREADDEPTGTVATGSTRIVGAAHRFWR